MAISGESKRILKDKIQEINKKLDNLDADILTVQSQKTPYDERLKTLQNQRFALRLQKQDIQGDLA